MEATLGALEHADALRPGHPGRPDPPVGRLENRRRRLPRRPQPVLGRLLPWPAFVT